jgi:hypothetical protein
MSILGATTTSAAPDGYRRPRITSTVVNIYVQGDDASLSLLSILRDSFALVPPSSPSPPPTVTLRTSAYISEEAQVSSALVRLPIPGWAAMGHIHDTMHILYTYYMYTHTIHQLMYSIRSTVYAYDETIRQMNIICTSSASVMLA